MKFEIEPFMAKSGFNFIISLWSEWNFNSKMYFRMIDNLTSTFTRSLGLRITMLNICTLCSLALLGQKLEYYKPIPADLPSLLAVEAKKIDKRYDVYIKQMKSQYKGKLGVKMANELKEGKEYLKEDILDGQFVFEHDIYNYVCSVFEKICKGNDINSEDYHILLRRSPELNAACYPDGTFIVNIGLFYYLENEHEFAAVIAHELAHKLLKHWERRSEYVFTKENEPGYQAELKEIKAQKNDRYDRAFDVFRGQLYDNMNVRRSYEFEADSLGYLLLKKSAYTSGAIYNALDFMVQKDSFEYIQISEETFRTIFNTPELSFKDEWLTIEDMSAYDYSLYKEKLDKDSISSHPETKDRLNYLTRVFPDIAESDRIEAEMEYTLYNEMSVMEIVPSLYQQKAYGSALHAALMLYEAGEDPDYHKAWIGFCLDKLANARKTLTFNNYISQVNPKEHSTAIQQFLSFMWNLKSGDLNQFATYYMNEYPLKI